MLSTNKAKLLFSSLHKLTPRIFINIVFFVVFIFFFFHLISGERGLISYSQTKQELSKSKARLTKVTAERKVLQNKVKNITDEHLDLDLLEEIAKSQLGYTGKNEIVFFNKD